MALAYDTDTKTISIRSGDSGLLIFKFKQEVNGLKATFAVKKHDSDYEDEAVIVKSFIIGEDEQLEPNTAYISLTSYDTEVLDVIPKNSRQNWQDYVWMLNVGDTEGSNSNTVIPEGFHDFPIFRVYRGSVNEYR